MHHTKIYASHKNPRFALLCGKDALGRRGKSAVAAPHAEDNDGGTSAVAAHNAEDNDEIEVAMSASSYRSRKARRGRQTINALALDVGQKGRMGSQTINALGLDAPYEIQSRNGWFYHE